MESIREGVDKIETSNRDNYDKTLPVFIYPDNESAKTTFPEFDKAIKKSSLVIQRHTIRDKKGNEITSAGKWIDNNWNAIGMSHFYKREFFSGIEAFDYVSRSYKGYDKYKALLWLVKSYNEIGSVSQSEPILAVLKNDKKFPKSLKKDFYAVQADYYLRRGLNEEAIKSLTSAIKEKPAKKTRARYSFILGQLYEQEKDYKKAIQFYNKTIDLKPYYELVFTSQIKQARLYDTKNNNTNKLKKSLLKMANDFKNKEYLDIIYYTLGEIEEKEKNIDGAISYYQRSTKSSTNNNKQKALSFLKLGEISFDRANYPASGAYYDSTMASLPKDYQDYDAIANRKKTLETLVGYIRTIQTEDSLQKIAGLSENERNKLIDKFIKQAEEEELRKKEEQELLANQNANPTSNLPNGGLPNIPSGTSNAWYFYNQTTLSFGINDFVKKWGNRKLEDNWRRSQKSLAFDNSINSSGADAEVNTKTTKKSESTAKSNVKTRDAYLKDLPINDTLLKQSNDRIIDAYYNLGSTYKEALNNNKRAIATFEDLNKRYTEHKYQLSVYYQLYRLYAASKNQTQADSYKNKLLNEFPNSEYSKIIKNPNYAAELNAQKGEVETFYNTTYDIYIDGNYTGALQNCKEAEQKFGKNEFGGKFSFIKAMSIGKLQGIDSLESALKELIAIYPKDETTPKAKEILEAIKKQRNPNEATTTITPTDTFTVDMASEHFVLIICPDDPKIADSFKSLLNEFNLKYYSNTPFTTSSNLFGDKQQMVIVKSFKGSEPAMQYLNNMSKDETLFNKKDRSVFFMFAISADNIPVFYKKKNIASYSTFFNDNYKSL